MALAKKYYGYQIKKREADQVARMEEMRTA
jgi:hypothetical protein